MSLQKIADKFNCATTTILYKMKKFEIPRRTKSEAQIGKNNPRWIGGKVEIEGYYYIYSPNHPNKNSLNYVAEHRLIMEKNIGRFLTKNEVIHHIDENRKNNNINNLRLCKNINEHYLLYHKKE